VVSGLLHLSELPGRISESYQAICSTNVVCGRQQGIWLVCPAPSHRLRSVGLQQKHSHFRACVRWPADEHR
jgi:hypothetical protein